MVGQLSANGAPQRLIGRALGLQGFWTGLAGVALGMTGAVLIGVFGRSTIERVNAADLPAFQYVARDLVVIALTGIAAAVVAAYVPARSAAKVPTLTALAGRRPLGKVPVRLVPIGVVVFGFGVLLLVLAAGSEGGDIAAAAGVLGGVMVMAGMCCCSPLAIDAMSRLAARAGRSWRGGSSVLVPRRRGGRRADGRGRVHVRGGGQPAGEEFGRDPGRPAPGSGRRVARRFVERPARGYVRPENPRRGLRVHRG
jgi:hypothetical protein